MTKRSSSKPQECLLVYDGNCRVCVAFKHRLERRDCHPAIRFVPYQSDEAAHLLGVEYTPSRPSMAYFFDSAGRMSRGVEAFRPFLTGLPGEAYVLRLWQVRWIRALISWSYSVFARNRYRWFGEVKKI
ncbi:MAG: DUF393 domain-containing protein [Nitrospirales bacterium]|nr:DUF393 domain-containing protein [Nitrospirales bacterium]